MTTVTHRGTYSEPRGAQSNFTRPLPSRQPPTGMLILFQCRYLVLTYLYDYLALLDCMLNILYPEYVFIHAEYIFSLCFFSVFTSGAYRLAPRDRAPRGRGTGLSWLSGGLGVGGGGVSNSGRGQGKFSSSGSGGGRGRHVRSFTR